jgi:hypothetical protein
LQDRIPVDNTFPVWSLTNENEKIPKSSDQRHRRSKETRSGKKDEGKRAVEAAVKKFFPEIMKDFDLYPNHIEVKTD